MKTNLNILLTGIVFTAILSSPAMGATLIVDDDFAPPWNSIQYAIGEATPDDNEIQVNPGPELES